MSLPVIIAGAGPCGLVTALTLQKEKIPFIILERADRKRFCSDVGSGFDLAPTAIDILENQLNVPGIEKICIQYAGMHLIDMNGTVLRDAFLSKVLTELDYGTVSRSDLQRVLLDALFQEKSEVEEKEGEESMLRCGVEVIGYKQEGNSCIIVNLNDGSSIKGRALLGCDGIHSRVRKCMVGGGEYGGDIQRNDELHFCKTTCWWGKVEVPEASTLQQAIEKTQTYKTEGTSFVWAMGTHKQPGSFMFAPISGNTLLWAFFMKADSPPVKTNDLVRRGGFSLNEKDKAELENIVSDRGYLIRLIIEQTDPSSITKVGLFDRENRNIPFAKDCVALLGDAAHPQSPFMGQGANMAITDGFVCATLLAHKPVEIALQDYDSDSRRKSVNSVIKQARSYGDICVSKNRFSCWMFRTVMRWMPSSFLIYDMITGDKSNKKFFHMANTMK